jgi:membrane protein DedA with SNARE-associated domain
LSSLAAELSSLLEPLREAANHAAALLAQGAAGAASSPSTLPGPRWVIEFLQSYGYVGIVAILILCGLGLPIPEEVTLVGSGYLSYLAKENGSDHPDWMVAAGVCVLGILLGDTVVYSLGRRFGNAVLTLPLIRHELTPHRIDKFDKLFARYGDRAIFFSRFFMGVRLASYFVAGRQRMPYWKFILLDLGGALISGPASVALGFYFGGNLHQALTWAHRSNWFLLAGASAAIVGGVVYAWRKAKRAKAPAP